MIIDHQTSGFVFSPCIYEFAQQQFKSGLLNSGVVLHCGSMKHGNIQFSRPLGNFDRPLPTPNQCIWLNYTDPTDHLYIIGYI